MIPFLTKRDPAVCSQIPGWRRVGERPRGGDCQHKFLLILCKFCIGLGCGQPYPGSPLLLFVLFLLLVLLPLLLRQARRAIAASARVSMCCTIYICYVVPPYLVVLQVSLTHIASTPSSHTARRGREAQHNTGAVGAHMTSRYLHKPYDAHLHTDS